MGLEGEMKAWEGGSAVHKALGSIPNPEGEMKS